MRSDGTSGDEVAAETAVVAELPKPHTPIVPVELGGPTGLEPTRYGDWEKNGRCIDF